MKNPWLVLYCAICIAIMTAIVGFVLGIVFEVLKWALS